MAANILSNSYEAATELYTSAIASLITIPTLLPSSPSSPMFSLYASSIFNSPVSFSFDIPARSFLVIPPVDIPVPLKDLVEDLTYWQIANIVWFILTVAVLSWMLDSHHSDDDDEVPVESTKAVDAIPTHQPDKLSVSPPVRSQRRRQTLETIATLINLEDIQKKAKSRNRSQKLRCRLPSVDNVTASSAPTSPTEVQGQLIAPPSGESTILLKKASEREKNRQRRRSIQDSLIKKQLEDVADYDVGMQIRSEQAEIRRKGSWKTSMLLGLRVPVGWTMG